MTRPDLQQNPAKWGTPFEVWRKESQVLRSKTGSVYCSRSCANSMNNHLFKTGENHPNYKEIGYRI